MLKSILGILLLSLLGLTACGPSAFVKGNYDEDVNRTNLLTDGWSESDMQNAVKALVGSLVDHPLIQRAKTPPLVMVTHLQNNTSEHIETDSVMEMVSVELMRGGRVRFVDKAARSDIDDEYQFQNSGRVSDETKKGPGGQVGADFLINGRVDSIVQEAGKDKTIYYKITLNVTNLKTGVKEWSDYKQIRKLFRKKSVGL